MGVGASAPRVQRAILETGSELRYRLVVACSPIHGNFIQSRVLAELSDDCTDKENVKFVFRIRS